MTVAIDHMGDKQSSVCVGKMKSAHTVAALCCGNVCFQQNPQILSVQTAAKRYSTMYLFKEAEYNCMPHFSVICSTFTSVLHIYFATTCVRVSGCDLTVCENVQRCELFFLKVILLNVSMICREWTGWTL